MRLFLTAILAALTLFGDDIRPTHIIRLDSPALDMVFRKKLYLSTEKGDIYEVIGQKTKKLYSLPHFITPMGDKKAQKALTIDVNEDNKEAAVGGEDGCLYISKGGHLLKSGFKTESIIKKVLFVNDNLVLIGLVSSQVTLFDIQTNKALYTIQIGTSPLSDMALSQDKKTAAIGGEAGIVFMLDSMNGKLKASYKNVNLDNIYKIDYQNKMIITAGQDRKAVLLREGGTVKKKLEAEFLVYAAALSPSASKAAVAIDEQSDIAVFDTFSYSKIATAKGHNATLNRIVFLSETEMASCADENKILIWRIK